MGSSTSNSTQAGSPSLSSDSCGIGYCYSDSLNPVVVGEDIHPCDHLFFLNHMKIPPPPPDIVEMAKYLCWDEQETVLSVSDYTVISSLENDKHIKSFYEKEQKNLEQFLKNHDLFSEKVVENFDKKKILYSDLRFFDDSTYVNFITDEIFEEDDRMEKSKTIKFFDCINELKKKKGGKGSQKKLYYVDDSAGMKILPNKIIQGEFVESTAMGDIYNGIMRPYKEFKVAVKIIHIKTENMSEENKKIIEDELEKVHPQATHTNCLKFFGVIGGEEKKGTMRLVFENFDIGGLRTFIRENLRLSLKSKFDIMNQIADGMIYLEKNDYLGMMEINPFNILSKTYQPCGKFTPCVRFKLSMFRINSSDGNEEEEDRIKSSIEKFNQIPEYLDPVIYSKKEGEEDGEDGECEDNSVPLTQSRVYSFAILMYELITTKIPYEEIMSKKPSTMDFMNKVLIDEERPKYETQFPFTEPLFTRSGVGMDMIELMTSCWNKDREVRPDGFDLIRMELGEIEYEFTESGVFSIPKYMIGVFFYEIMLRDMKERRICVFGPFDNKDEVLTIQVFQINLNNVRLSVGCRLLLLK